MQILTLTEPQSTTAEPQTKIEGPFAIVPQRAVYDSDLGHAAFRVLVALCSHANADRLAWPSSRRLADLLGISQWSVRDHVRSLEKSGYIERIPAQRGDGSQTSNRYRILFDQPAPPVG